MSELLHPDIEQRLKPVKSILVSQPTPTAPSPYTDLAKKYDIKIDFRSFIEVQPISAKDFRKQKINIAEHTAVIFTSRNAVTHFFDVCKEARVDVSPEMKYFCISDQTANYLQKYILVRKRKIFSGDKTASDLFPLLKKHKTEKYLFPCSNVRKEDIPEFMQKNGYNMTEMVLYKTVSSDLSDLSDVNYDMLAFFSPSGITSLFENFPDFKQNNTRIAAFGPTTAAAVRGAGLILDVEAPMPNAPSMTGAIESYIKRANNLV